MLPVNNFSCNIPLPGVKIKCAIFFSLESKKKKKQNLSVQSSAELLASSTMVLSPLCPTYLNVRPSGNSPTQDHMLSPQARQILDKRVKESSSRMLAIWFEHLEQRQREHT